MFLLCSQAMHSSMANMPSIAIGGVRKILSEGSKLFYFLLWSTLALLSSLTVFSAWYLCIWRVFQELEALLYVLTLDLSCMVEFIHRSNTLQAVFKWPMYFIDILVNPNAPLVRNMYMQVNWSYCWHYIVNCGGFVLNEAGFFILSHGAAVHQILR